jgi:hypothetical protein
MRRGSRHLTSIAGAIVIAGSIVVVLVTADSSPTAIRASDLAFAPKAAGGSEARLLHLVPGLHPWSARLPRRSGLGPEGTDRRPSRGDCRAYTPGRARRLPIPTHFRGRELLIGAHLPPGDRRSAPTPAHPECVGAPGR